MTPAPSRTVLDFWLSEPMKRHWFKKSDAVDQQIVTQFADTYEAARTGRLDDWMEDGQGALTLIIILDQFPRNMFRGSPRSFESGSLALQHARTALDRSLDQDTDATARQFFYLPFMHSEDMADQQMSVMLYEKLENSNSLHFAREHRDIVAQFGRFPHRNAALGRENTASEAVFLKTHKGF